MICSGGFAWDFWLGVSDLDDFWWCLGLFGRWMCSDLGFIFIQIMNCYRRNLGSWVLCSGYPVCFLGWVLCHACLSECFTILDFIDLGSLISVFVGTGSLMVPIWVVIFDFFQSKLVVLLNFLGLDWLCLPVCSLFLGSMPAVGPSYRIYHWVLICSAGLGCWCPGLISGSSPVFAFAGGSRISGRMLLSLTELWGPRSSQIWCWSWDWIGAHSFIFGEQGEFSLVVLFFSWCLLPSLGLWGKI